MTAKPRARASASKTTSAKSRAESAEPSAAPKADPPRTNAKASKTAATAKASAPVAPKPASSPKKPASSPKKPASSPKKPASAKAKPRAAVRAPDRAAQQPATAAAATNEPVPTQPAIVAPSGPAAIEPSLKVRKRGLGELSKHAFAPVSAPLMLATRPRVQVAAPALVRPSAALDGDAISYLRAELTSLLAVLEEPSA